MKQNRTMRLIIAFCMCLVMSLAFTACKDEEVYAGSSDFESYPDYWNDFNDDTAEDIYVPKDPSDTPGETPDFSDDDTSNTTSSSSVPDTDGDGVTNNKDSDIDGDGIKNPDDDDIDGDGVKNEDDNDVDGDGTVNEKDPTPEGPKNNEGPLVPLK